MYSKKKIHNIDNKLMWPHRCEMCLACDKGCPTQGIFPIKSNKTGDHTATITYGKPSPVHSMASGPDYPGVGPELSLFHDLKKVNYDSITDKECIDGFFDLSRKEGIIPAFESAHAVGLYDNNPHYHSPKRINNCRLSPGSLFHLFFPFFVNGNSYLGRRLAVPPVGLVDF